MGSAFHQLCPRYSGTLIPTAPTAIRLWETFSKYCICLDVRRSLFPSKTIPKDPDPSYKIDLDLWDCLDGSRSLGIVLEGLKTHIIAKFQRMDLVICSHSREGKTPILQQYKTVPV